MYCSDAARSIRWIVRMRQCGLLRHLGVLYVYLYWNTILTVIFHAWSWVTVGYGLSFDLSNCYLSVFLEQTKTLNISFNHSLTTDVTLQISWRLRRIQWLHRFVAVHHALMWYTGTAWMARSNKCMDESVKQLCGTFFGLLSSAMTWILQ